MIRLFLVAFGALSVVIFMLISRAGAPEDMGAPQVTRTDTSLQTSVRQSDVRPTEVRRAPPPQATTSDTLDMAMLAQSIVSEYRRPASGDRLNQPAPAQVRPLARTAPKDVPTPPANAPDQMRSLTDSVLASLGTSRAAAPRSPPSLDALVTQAMRAGQSDAYLEALLNEANGTSIVKSPEAQAPAAKINTATLSQPVKPKLKPAPAQPQQASQTTLPDEAPSSDDPLTYTVQPGDSLAGIALRHYGTTTAYEIIYRANRDKLPSPSAVKPGMTLTIPAL